MISGPECGRPVLRQTVRAKAKHTAAASTEGMRNCSSEGRAVTVSAKQTNEMRASVPAPRRVSSGASQKDGSSMPLRPVAQCRSARSKGIWKTRRTAARSSMRMKTTTRRADGDRYEAGESPECPQDGATRSTGSSAVSRLAIEGPGRLRFWPHGWRGPQSPLDPPDGSAHEGADASQAGVVGELAAQLGVGGVELDYSLELDVAQGNGGHANRSECGPGGGQDEGGA